MWEGRGDKLVVAALKAGVSGTLVNHTLVSKGRIRATCQQLVLRVMHQCVCERCIPGHFWTVAVTSSLEKMEAFHNVPVLFIF